MVNVPSKEQRKAAYERSIAGVPASYKAGIDATQGWKEAAMNGQGLYEEKMRQPDVLAKRAKSLAKVNEQDWKRRASEVGSSRIAQGMSANSQKQADNYEPIAEALRSVSLPPRSSDPMQNIDSRTKPIVMAAVNAAKNR